MRLSNALVYVVPGAIALVLPLMATASVRPGGSVLVVGSPWSGAGGTFAIVAQANGVILRDTLVPWIVVARSDAADFDTRLHQAGAWLTLDTTRAFACLAPTIS